MLRSVLPRRPVLRPLLVSALRLLAAALPLLLISRARIAGGLAPFAPSCFAAGLQAGLNPVAMLAGCALGCLCAGCSVMELLPLLGCAATLLLDGAYRLFAVRFGEREAARDFLTGMEAGLGVLLPGLAFSGGLYYNLTSSALAAMAAALMAPALVGSLGVRPSRRLLMPEEQLSLSLMALLCLTGLRGLPVCGRALSSCAAALLTLAFSASGAGMGALAGLASGMALSLGGSDPFTGASLGLCGLLAGCVNRLPRGAACLALLLGNLLTVSQGVGYAVGALEHPPVLAACALYCLLPGAWLHRLGRWIAPSLPHPDPERMAARLRRRAGERISSLGEAFGALADGYGEEDVLPDEQRIVSIARHALCDGCEDYAACWTGETSAAGRLICRLAAEALSGRAPTRVADLPPDRLRHCRRSAQIDRRLLPALTSAAGQRREALKRGEARSLMGKQFREAQRLLDSLSTQLKSGGCLNQEYALLARAALDRAGIRVRDVTALLDGRLEIVCVLSGRVWDAQAARRAAALLSDELGIPLSPVLSHGRVSGECELRLVQAPALTAAFGTASRAAEEGQPCGDSFTAQLLPDGRLIAAVSDGMGHGEAASAESRRCISLLRKFVGAGVERDAALSAVNALLLLKSGDDMFATADLCVVDLYTGVASFSKLGACRSFLLRERSTEQISGGRLPLGVLDRVEPAVGRAEVHPGETIVLFSDGVADELKPGQAEELMRLLRRLRRQPPQRIAEALIAHASARDAHPDDMTALVVRILARPVRPECVK